ncbi:gamma-glutamylcyclotransferase [Cognatishimia sp. WU-CL00825]|uniref:gamma-glutamylcyclotransferase family protein n=1 Tax=Cognatishimia sp. WU-CL00825 TaxID=3127658 RepID=UPI00310542C5
MQTPYFFGYGSLVNRQTHNYPKAQQAQLQGWRRVWRQTTLRPRPFLTVEPCAGSTITGLIAQVPNHDWQALDQREAVYDRILVRSVTASAPSNPASISTYTVPPEKYPAPNKPHAILLSYLDVVVQGYLQEFGTTGAAAFFTTTVGWNAPIRDDRQTPLYPRSQRLLASETDFVDCHLAKMGCEILT